MPVSSVFPAQTETLRDSFLDVFSEDEILRITRDILAIESHRDAPGHETPVAIHIRDLLRREGIEAELTEVRDGRCNVIAVLPGRGGGPRLMFNGHIDTVPPGRDEAAIRASGGQRQALCPGRLRHEGRRRSAALCDARAKARRRTARGRLIFTGVIAEED